MVLTDEHIQEQLTHLGKRVQRLENAFKLLADLMAITAEAVQEKEA